MLKSSRYESKVPVVWIAGSSGHTLSGSNAKVVLLTWTSWLSVSSIAGSRLGSWASGRKYVRGGSGGVSMSGVLDVQGNASTIPLRIKLTTPGSSATRATETAVPTGNTAVKPMRGRILVASPFPIPRPASLVAMRTPSLVAKRVATFSPECTAIADAWV